LCSTAEKVVVRLQQKYVFMDLLEMGKFLGVYESLFIFQGQVTISAKFDKGIYLPEDAEFYFVYDGSMKRHIMFAERIGDNALQSLVPGECYLCFIS